MPRNERRCPSIGVPPAYRTIFISDTHLGTRGCRSDFLADFLRESSCHNLFLVGDIIDGWRLRKSWYWDESHDEVLKQIVRHARAGTEVTYIPGNHDEMFRNWLPIGLEICGIRMRRESEHTTADGKRLLVMHGDEFDSVVRYAKFLALLGDWAYTAALVINRWFNAIRRRLGYPYWSLSAWLKRQVKEAVKAIDRFESRARRGSAAPRLRRRRLRPHPPCRDARRARHAVPERRRLGGKLHRAGGASRRPAGTDRLGGAQPAVVLRRRAQCGFRQLPDSLPLHGHSGVDDAAAGAVPSHPDRNGCLEAAGQRRRPHADHRGARNCRTWVTWWR